MKTLQPKCRTNCSAFFEEEYKFLEKDLLDIYRLFYVDEPILLHCKINIDDNFVQVDFDIDGKKFCNKYVQKDLSKKSQLLQKRILKRYARQSLYFAFKEICNKSFPYGGFVGIRPTKLYRQVQEETGNLHDFFVNFLDFDEEKFELVQEVVKTQMNVPQPKANSNELYVGIPFCVGKCSYCSFSSCDITKYADIEDEYVEALTKELQFVLDNFSNFNSIYIGGGTPSVLKLQNIEKILKILQQIPKCEFTFEVGRPDSASSELFDLLQKYNVNRICINPQSTCNETMKKIGRKHTYEDIISAYNLAKNYAFDINMDLIMGIDDCFEKSLQDVCKLSPQNITVHTLALKSGARLKEEHSRLFCENIERNSVFAYEFLSKNGYFPYYLYRQKYSAGNLENVGYCKSQKACIYNVNNMEERTNIIAIGANAISKRIFCGNERIERQSNPKDIVTYISKIDKICEEKQKLFQI